MDNEIVKKKELEFLIEAWEGQAERGNLSDKGLEYLAGLKEAFDMIFPTQVVG